MNLIMASLACQGAHMGLQKTNPTAIAELRAGRRIVANAAWWGFDAQNATKAVQSAIDSGARKVIVPNVGRDWIVDPIRLASDQEVVFEKGVVVAARKGGFAGLNDCLFKAEKKRNLTIRGYGATWRMQKPEYVKGEWRMCLELDSCTNVKVEGLTLAGSGGDGIYIGDCDPKQPYCKDVVIRDCVLDDNRRQGMSVISAVNLLVERCLFRSTSGTAPQAGVDLEPNVPTERLSNVVFRKCVMQDNAGAGVLIYTGALAATSEPLSVLFDRCLVRSTRGSGIEVGGFTADHPRGTVEFRKCFVDGCYGAGLNVFNKSKDAAGLLFRRCQWKSVARAPGCSPMQLEDWDRDSTRMVGGVTFVDCVMEDDLDRPFLVARESARARGVGGLHGTLTVHNPHGARMDLGDRAVDVTVRIAQGISEKH